MKKRRVHSCTPRGSTATDSALGGDSLFLQTCRTRVRLHKQELLPEERSSMSVLLLR